MNNNLYIAAIGRAANETSRNFTVPIESASSVCLTIFADKCPNFTSASHFTTSQSAFSSHRETS